MSTQMQTSRPDRRSVRKARTRQAILSAAQTILLRRGYHAASVEEIADHADVAVGSIYTYFGSKEGLFRELVAEALTEDEASMDRAHEAADVAGRLDAMRHELIPLHRRNPILSVLALAATGTAPRELTEPVVERTQAELGRLEAAIADGVRAGILRDIDPKVAATFLWAAWSGLTALHLRADGLRLTDEEFEATSELGFRIMATGLLKRPGTRQQKGSRR